MDNLPVKPTHSVDVLLDTDAYNEIDDQFAIAYLIRSDPRLRVVGLHAAPFLNARSSSPGDGMEKSLAEILRLIDLAGRHDLAACVQAGSTAFLRDEKTPARSEAAEALVRLSAGYQHPSPLYVVAIGAITNVASALLLDPTIVDRITVVWLGGHDWHWPDTREFNMQQDIAAARVVFGSGVRLVQLPCMGVVSAFATSGPELTHWLAGRNELCDYLVDTTCREAESYRGGKVWTRVIWDVTAVAWLLDPAFMREENRQRPIPTYGHQYTFPGGMPDYRYVYHIERDLLFADLFDKLSGPIPSTPSN